MSNTASLKKEYQDRIVPALTKEFGYKSVMQVPVLKKIVINQGLGMATADKKIIDIAISELSTITGQKAVATVSKKDISNFKLRKKMPIGVMVTLRREQMYEFLERLVRVALPRKPGQVLKDLMESGAFATVILNKIFRQAGESDIVVNAHLINEGKQISLNNKSKDFFFLERDNVNVIYKHMILLITEKLPRYVHAGTFDIQVLTPMRKGALGVEVLNKILQQYLNPPSPEKEEVGHGDGILRLGDKVMQIKNNYQLEWEIVSKYGIAIDSGQGVFNGDTGIIREINETAKTLVVEYDDMRRVTYSLSGLDEIELAYAITIHKSQGSEYPAVIMPLLTGPRMLFNRNLLYTGVTRAKNCVTILGSSSTVMQMIENANEQKRFTGLKDRICEMMETMQTES